MGCKMTDEFFARQNPPMAHCRDFRTTIDIVSKLAFKVFLNITADVDRFDDATKSCFLVFRENPFAEYVILPISCAETLWYSNIICGMIRGSLEMIGIIVKAYFCKDILRGDTETVVRVEFVKVLKAKED
jgi:trafficking protein particle complex subunit 3